MKVLRQLDRHLERCLMLWLYAFVVIVIVVEVLRRFALDYSSLWGEEAARYAFIYLTWIGAAAAVKSNGHIRIDLLFNILPPRGVTMLNILAGLCTVLLAVFALRLSWEPVAVSMQYGSVTDGLRLTKAWFLFAVPFGFSLVLLRAVQMTWISVTDLMRGSVSLPDSKLFD